MIYSIRDWGTHFEKSQTRKCAAMKWVPVSNKHDGKSYRRLMRMERRAELYAVWVLLIQVASKCPVRGVLADSDGPLTPDDLELKTGMPAESFAYAMPVLASSAIGWLTTDCDETTSTLPADYQQTTIAVVADYQHATSTLPARYQHGGAPVELQDRTLQDKTRQEIPPISPQGGSEQTQPRQRRKLVRENPPSLDDVAAYIAERGSQIDAIAFHAHYTANGWVQGNGKPLVDWHAAVTTWEKQREHGLGFRGGIPPDSKAEIRKREEAEAARKIDEWVRRSQQNESGGISAVGQPPDGLQAGV